MKPTLPHAALMPVLLQDVLVMGGRTWMRASSLARHLGQPIDLLRGWIDQMRQVMGGRWWLHNVQVEGLDVRLSRDGVAVLPMEGLPGMRLKALCLAAFEEAERLRLHLVDQQAGLGQALEPPDSGLAPEGISPSAAPAASGPGTAPATLAMAGHSLPVPFRGATLYLVEHRGEPYVPMRPIVEAMGLAWAAQTVKLNSDKARWGVSLIETPSLGGEQKALCIPLRKVAAWLMTISPNKVRPDLRDRIIAYQNECDDVLWRYWSEWRAERTNPTSGEGVAPRQIAPRAGPFVLDNAFIARVYVALGRKALQTEVLRRLLLLGALEGFLSLSIRQIAQEGRRLSPDGVHRALRYLCQKGVVEKAPGQFSYRVVEQAVRRLLDATEGLPLDNVENVLVGALEQEISQLQQDKRRKLH